MMRRKDEELIMKRLTKFDGEEYIPACFDTCTEKDCDDCPKSDPDLWINEVGKYEDAEESGLLLRLPCKVGDTVYHIKNLYKGKKITSRVIEQLCIDNFVIGDNGKPQANVCDNERNDWHYYDIVDFGRYVFLTLEEAEKVLKERDAK